MRMECLNGLEMCHACTCRPEAKKPLSPTGTETVGVPMIVGRNPSRWEDEIGEPFIGPCGSALDSFLFKLGLARRDVYITNAVKCHTKGDRPPDSLEIKTCSEKWLHKEGAELKPCVTVVLGADAYKAIFGSRIIPWIKYTGKVVNFGDAGAVVLLPHPRHPAWRKKSESVLKEIRKILDENSIPNRQSDTRE